MVDLDWNKSNELATQPGEDFLNTNAAPHHILKPSSLPVHYLFWRLGSEVLVLQSGSESRVILMNILYLLPQANALLVQVDQALHWNGKNAGCCDEGPRIH